MATKKDLIRKLQKNPDKYWKVKLFEENGFTRKKCSSCGKFFWTLDPQTELCGDAPCVRYGFINNSPCKRKMDYIETWRAIEKFFVKRGHESIQSYPSVCRWFPGLYFTIASIVSFQRKVGRETVFEFPANPLIIPQSCMRFNDIPNVGRTGKHYTNFVMIGQHSLYDGRNGYWKDRCAELDFELVTRVFGIKPEEITWIEDAWLGPAAFGYSLEYFARGLELGNAVFTEFIGTLDKYKIMKNKVIDMGAGLERFAWITQGTPTSYDATFGPVMEKLKKNTDYDRELFLRYAELAGGMNIDEARSMKDVKTAIAKKLGTSFEKLERHIAPLEALYAIADHTKALLFAVSDGALPSNVGGGYNLRVILRRALEFIKEFGFDIDIVKIAEEHARYLKPMFPNLSAGLENFSDIIDVERKRLEETRGRGRKIVESILEKARSSRDSTFDESKLIQLYESNGIQPELVQEIAREKKIRIEIPDDFYTKLSERHMTEREEEEEHVDVSGIPATKKLYHENPQQTEFRAKVLKIIDKNKIVLDKTLFYPESGGQDADSGYINNFRVFNVQKFGDVIVHYLENPKLREGMTIAGKIDRERREQLAKHHTSIHIINLAAREILGRHVFQAGSKKTTEKAHLDITHYKPISKEEIEKIEEKANDIVKKRIPIKIEMLPRNKAENKYGMGIYQGGAVPEKTIRIVSIGNLDHEACGGTHYSNTGDVGRIIVLGSERIQDGIDRITIKSGAQAEMHIRRSMKTMENIIKMIKKDLHFVKTGNELKRFTEKNVLGQINDASSVFSVHPDQLEKTIERFLREIVQQWKEINTLRKRSGMKEKKLDEYLEKKTMKTLGDLSRYIFSVWKAQKKELEKIRKEFAALEAEKLLKKANENRLFDVIAAERKEMIEIAHNLVSKNPELSVILANQAGDIVGMSRKTDIGKKIKEICQLAGGSGGGSKELGQGKAELSKLLKVIKSTFSVN